MGFNLEAPICLYKSNLYLTSRHKLWTRGNPVCLLVQTGEMDNDHKGRTIWYLGGGGLELLLLANFFFYLRWKTSFFGDQHPTIFFYVSLENFFVICFPYYVRYHLVFFLVNIFFINFDNKLFFSAHIFNKLFFSDFCDDKLFFQF